MPPGISRGFGFTSLLRTFDDIESSVEELREGEGGELRQTLSSQYFSRALCWTICSATAIYTSKQLLTTHGFHYPLTIAFGWFAFLLVVYTIVVRLPRGSWNTPDANPSRWSLRQPDGDGSLLSGRWLVMIPASIAAAASVPMLLEGLLHMPSLAAMVMLFPLVYAAESVVLLICCSPSRSRTWLPWEAILATAASTIVLYNEYRLEVPGLIWGVTGVLFIGLSRAFFIVGSERSGSDIQTRLEAYHGFAIMTMIFGMLISGIPALLKFERGQFSQPLSIKTIGLLVVNIASLIGTAFSGTSVFAYSPLSFEDTEPRFSNIPIPNLEFLSSFASSLLVIFLAMHSGPVFVSWIQLAAFLIAAICLVGSDQIHNYLLTCMNNAQDQINKSRMESVETRKPSRAMTGGVLFLIVMVISCALSTLSSASINSLPPSMASRLDTLYRPVTRFEIVVSMYNESPSQVKSMLDSIKSTTFLSLIDPHITIYTKNPAHNLDELKEATGASTVERLDNLGREGGTYLSHIVHRWDSLAEQTMFIQAHAHNMRELIPRINSYLVPETGFLSLGFAGITCSCETCSDRWGWEDTWDIIPAMYQEIYSAPCSSSTPILLTYKGQFVASARRIRGIGRNVYAGLLETITSRDGWSHNATVIGGIGNGGVTGIDSADNPYFGFTMERIWGLVLQCATDRGVAAKCPSLLSGMSRWGKVGDCQCLDGG